MKDCMLIKCYILLNKIRDIMSLVYYKINRSIGKKRKKKEKMEEDFQIIIIVNETAWSHDLPLGIHYRLFLWNLYPQVSQGLL